MIGFQDMGVNF